MSLLSTFLFVWTPRCVAHVASVILRHCCKKVLLCLLFSTREFKNRNIHALWMYFPSRKCAVVGVCHWLHTITWASASQAAIGWHLWGLCEEKLFWQDPGAQRSRWKPGEGQCRWNQESGSGGRVPEMASPRLWVRSCWDATSQLQQRAGMWRDDHMVIATGEDNDSLQWHSESTCHKHKFSYFTMK